MDENIKLEMTRNFKSRNVDIAFFETLGEVKDRIIELIPINCSVGVGKYLERSMQDLWKQNN